MPGVEIETVTLDEEIGHPLDAVLERVDRSKTGPLMIVGLERSNPSSAKERPILYALNMSRPEWPKKLPRPIVFWVPEYLLGLMGREAPDFLDWRSDTLFFPDSTAEDFLLLRSEVWLSELSESMSEGQRRARIKELKSRLASHSEVDDPVIMAAQASWYKELGILLYRMGELSGARESYLMALEIERKLRREDRVADLLGNLGLIDYALGKVGDAENRLLEALRIHRRLRKRYGEATGLTNLASIQLESGRIESAEQYVHQAMEVARESGFSQVMPLLHNMIFGLAVARRDPTALKLGEEALSEASKAGLLSTRAEILHNLGLLFSLEGDLNRAEQCYREALEISRMLGMRVDSAKALLSIGALQILREDNVAAREALKEAERLSLEIGAQPTAQKAEALLAILDASAPPQTSIPQ